MRPAAVTLLVALSGCGLAERSRYDAGRETPFYQQQLALAAAPAPGPATPRQLAEDSLARVARRWEKLAHDPTAQIALLDTRSAPVRQAMAAARTDARLDDLLTRPTPLTVLSAVVARNPRIASAQAAWRATVARYGQAAAYEDLLRRYNAWTRRAMVPGKSVGTESVAPAAPFPGMRGLLTSLTTRDARVARDRYLETVNQVLTDARKQLHRLAYLDTAIGIIEGHRRAVTAQASVARTRYKSGGGPYVDVLKAATELAELEDRLLTVKEARLAAAAALNSLLRRPTGAAIPAVAQQPAPAAPKLRGTALEELVLSGSLALSALGQKLGRMRDMLRMASNRDYFKTLQRYYFFDARKRPAGGFDRRQPQENRRMPAMDARSGQVTSFLAELRARIQATEAARDALRLTLRRETQALYFTEEEWRRRVRLYRREILPKAQQTLAASETAYQGGQLKFISMVDALRRLLNARLAETAAVRRALDLRAELEQLANSRRF